MDDAHVVAELEGLEALFGVRRAALALLCLATDGPMRWTDVGRTLTQLTGEPITEKATTRALHALQRLGLVTVVEGEDGNHLYALTALGTHRARQARDMLDSLRNPPPPQSETQGQVAGHDITGDH
jgi:DNA-binding PadR family transcriptional regulator